MAKPYQRAIALVTALLFLGTSVVFGLFVIFETRNSNNDTNEDITAALNQADDNSQNTDEQTEADMLQGTKLENFSPVEQVSELQIVDITEGTGEVVKEGATVTAHYTGALAKDGTIFQSSHDMGRPIPFSLSGVIRGWTEGVPGMKVGGKRRLVIPYEMAYGEAGSPEGGIPAKADLVFDIEVVSVEQ